MRSRLHAAFVAGLLGMLTWKLPPVSYLSGAALGLYVLRKGPREGWRVLFGATLITALLAQLTIGSPAPALAMVVALWLPVGLVATVLRASSAQGSALVAVGLLSALLLIGLHLAGGDLTAMWREWLAALEKSLPPGTGLGLGPAGRDHLAQVMTGLVIAAMATSLFGTVLLARWWQSLLYNPGGFGEEFCVLTLPRGLLYVAGVVGLTAIAQGILRGGFGLGTELLLVVTVLYMFQGLAVVHHQARTRRTATGWLVLLYVVLALLPQYMILLLGLVGAADALVNLRGLGAGRARRDE